MTSFIHALIEEDLKTGRITTLRTRFPPEPNGFLHIGHAKSMCLNFSLAENYGGYCHLRFDDTNPEKEEERYIDAIDACVEWLGFSHQGHRYFASDYFPQLFSFACALIQAGLAYVDQSTPEMIQQMRGTLTTPGTHSPDKQRSPEEHLALFTQMRDGVFPDGHCVLRLNIDMTSPNMNMRDPAIYRIRHAAHPRTGHDWCIYPLYDYTHCISDALEQITHSICTLEFEDHRPLYNWILHQLTALGCLTHPLPQQIEYARLNLTRTITSKRQLHRLITQALVDGWEDPRMPTLLGLRRRGYTAGGIKDFCQRIGITKSDTVIEYSYLEECIREDLQQHATHYLGIVDPVPLIITNYQDVEPLVRHQDPQKAPLHWAPTLWVEQEDCRAESTAQFFRLAPGQEVRLKYGYIIFCEKVDVNDAGQITAVYARCDYDTRSGTDGANARKIKGTIHFLAPEDCVAATFRHYEPLFNEDSPQAESQPAANSLIIHTGWIEQTASQCVPETPIHLERLGYYVTDRYEHQPGKNIVLNRSVSLKAGKKKKA